MAVFQAGEDDPGWDDAEKGDSEVKADTDEVVGVAFRLHTIRR